MSQRSKALSALVSAVAILAALNALLPVAAAQPANQPVIYLNQAWSEDDREWYFRDEHSGYTIGRYGPIFIYSLKFQTPILLPIIGFIQVRQSAIPSQIVRRDTLRQTRSV